MKPENVYLVWYLPHKYLDHICSSLELAIVARHYQIEQILTNEYWTYEQLLGRFLIEKARIDGGVIRSRGSL